MKNERKGGQSSENYRRKGEEEAGDLGLMRDEEPTGGQGTRCGGRELGLEGGWEEGQGAGVPCTGGPNAERKRRTATTPSSSGHNHQPDHRGLMQRSQAVTTCICMTP